MTTEKYQVFQTTGGVSIEVDLHQITIEQEGLHGEEADAVFIPRVMFTSVLDAIFDGLDIDELKEIARLTEAQAKNRMPGSK